MNALSKEFISIEIDGFDDFINACEIGKHSEARCSRQIGSADFDN